MLISTLFLRLDSSLLIEFFINLYLTWLTTQCMLHKPWNLRAEVRSCLFTSLVGITHGVCVIALGAAIKGLTRDLQPAFVLHFNLVSKLICKRSLRSHGLWAPVKQRWRFVFQIGQISRLSIINVRSATSYCIFLASVWLSLCRMMYGLSE